MWGFDISTHFREKPKMVIVQNYVITPSHGLDFTQVTHVGLYKEIKKSAKNLRSFQIAKFVLNLHEYEGEYRN